MRTVLTVCGWCGAIVHQSFMIPWNLGGVREWLNRAVSKTKYQYSMKRYRVCFLQEIHGEVEISAENINDAEQKAADSTAINWDGEGQMKLCDVYEIDEHGNMVDHD